MKKHIAWLPALVLALVAAGCTTSKSSDPLSPTVAGPIPGVNITAPSPVQPTSGSQVSVDKQPITLMVNNSTTNSPRPLTYLFEVATDSGFANKVFSRENVAPGTGQTSTRLPDALATGRTYYWRARAQDGANSSDYSGAASFSIFTPIVIGKPGLIGPVNNDQAASNAPTFVIANSSRSGPIVGIRYTIEVSTQQSFADPAKAIWAVDEQANQTSLAAPAGLSYSTQYFWHARAQDIGSNTLSDWSDTQAFRTPALVIVPPPGGGGGGGGGPVDGDWTKCGSTPGQALVECVHAVVQPGSSGTRAFEVTKRVAWLLRGQGAGLLIKNGGENTISWAGYSFSISRICYPDGHIYKVISDAGDGGANGPTYADNGFVDPSLYVPAIQP